MQNRFFSPLLILTLLLCGYAPSYATIVKGTVTDRETQEPLIGASIRVMPGEKGAVTDLDGQYLLQLPQGKYSIRVTYVGYREKLLTDYEITGDTLLLDLPMDSDDKVISELRVVAQARHDTEVAQLEEQRKSLLVQSGVSAQEVAKTQDKDASEVIRRIPGISIIDDKFVMVRGLSQRYNNVWLNGGAVPSSEADSRAFSFDIIPSAQIENLVIIKSPAPEYPADFTGGFVLLNTKRQPIDTGLDISLGIGLNDRTHFQDFYRAKGSATDFLGFDNGLRHLEFGRKGSPTFYEHSTRIDPIRSGFNNDWKTHRITPIGDLKLQAGYAHTWNFSGARRLSLVSALNYSNTMRTMLRMENSLYGPYDTSNRKSIPFRKATDDQYTHDIRLGAMMNLSFVPRNNRHLFEWKNVFNQISRDRYSERWGINAQADRINDMEYFYSSRPTFNSQFTSRHQFNKDEVDWSLGYAFAQRDLPDRRLIERTDRTDETMGIYRISREFTRLNEHTLSLGGNYRRDLMLGSLKSLLKSGLYGEYRTREYQAREFQYGWQPDHNLPAGFMFDPHVADNVLIDSNYGPDKLYMYEEINFLNNYKAHQMMGAAYAGMNFGWKQFDFYAGLRYEFCRQSLDMNTRQFEQSYHTTDYDYNDLFPSINATWHLTDTHQLRVAYGRSTNRPEFRELSSSVFYDFDLGSNVMGNPLLKAAYIDNVDLRWEWYPSKGETVSLALFYKHFRHPIEWTYTVAGGTDLIYSFVNADGANNYGVELDVRKSLDFIGLRHFSWSFNGALIKSKVTFDGSTNNINRPMQGQSPYLVNTGLFYASPRHDWNVAVLYNIIGKRIIGVGNRYGTATDGSSRNIPNSYEMPRHSLDFSLSKKWGDWSLKFSMRDILAQRYTFKQMEDIEIDGRKRTIQETARSFRPGRTFSLTAGYRF